MQYGIMPLLAVDMDGAIRRSKAGHQFVHGKEDVEIIPGVEEKLLECVEGGWLVCLVTNQGGVAFGFRSAESMQEEIEYTLALFKQNPFHAVYACFHHPGGRDPIFARRTLQRKPDYGMLVLAERDAYMDYQVFIDWENSCVVGDREEDRQLAVNAGIRYCPPSVFFGRTRPENEPVEYLPPKSLKPAHGAGKGQIGASAEGGLDP